MTLELGDVIARMGSRVVREHTPLNVPTIPGGVEVWTVTIPVGHVLAVEITTNAPVTADILVRAPDMSWAELHAAGGRPLSRLTIVTAPGHEGPAKIAVGGKDPFTATGITTTLIPT